MVIWRAGSWSGELMVSAATLKKLESAYKAWNDKKGSTAEPWFDLMADLVDWKSIAGGAQDMRFTRPHSTKQQVRDYFSELAQEWQMEFYHVRTFLVEGDKVAVIGECCWRHRKTGKIVHTPKLDLLRFQHERIAGFFEFFDTEQAIQATAPGSGARNVPQPLYPANGVMIFQGVNDDSKANIRLLERLYRTWNDTKGQSADEILNFLAPHVSWGSLANGANALAFTSRKLSKEDVRAYFNGLADAFEMNFFTVDDFLAAADYVLMTGVCSFTNRTTGRTFAGPKADLWRFSNGQAEEFFEYYDTAAALATTH
jgi:ketosteroid isomerase-like protein